MKRPHYYPYNRFRKNEPMAKPLEKGAVGFRGVGMKKIPEPPKKEIAEEVAVLSEEFKSLVCESAYLGNRGYTIPKSVLGPREIQFLKKDTTIAPKMTGPSFGAPGVVPESVPYPYYRENDTKMFLPRAYGITRYGLPFENQLSFGRMAKESLSFASDKPLRDYQNTIIQTYLDHISKQVLEFEISTETVSSSEVDVGMRDNAKDLLNSSQTHLVETRTEKTWYGGGGILEVPCGRGKTVMALKIISEIGRPALIYVNKGFLADQWLERIATYLPKASVGRVQADIFDIEGRDIVICMIQTIYNRDYVSKNAFRDFGITVIDEVHRIGSGEYSKALFNITTPYVLGISATVDRKDGMETVLKMFIGPMLYSDKRQDGDCVQIRAIEYADLGDEKYNRVEEDFRGNVKYATMMSKICEHRPRIEFVYRLLCDLVEEYPENLSEDLGEIFASENVNFTSSPFVKPNEPQTQCPVCRNSVGMSKINQTSCKHSFCEKCLDELENPKCPICKKRFTLVLTLKDQNQDQKLDTNSDDNTVDKSDAKSDPKKSGKKGGQKEEEIRETLTEYPGQNQIIVLSQYRELLRELHRRIMENGLTTVGFYVGGMKQHDLDMSKTKQIILATYSMASEGLDVATLSTLVFATPRTDIKQSVGRILRQKHARNPIVVDVLDTHKTFKNQWSKRRAYYRQNGYAIYQCGHENYSGMCGFESRSKMVYHPSMKTSNPKSCRAVANSSDSDSDAEPLAFDGVCMI